MQSTLAVSTAGLAFIAAWEGYRSDCYDDSERNCTIGIGHLVHYGPTTEEDRRHWGSISYKRALQLLAWDLDRDAIAAIRDSIAPRLRTNGLAPHELDALASLGLNCGPWSLRSGGAVMHAVNAKPRATRPANLPAVRRWRAGVRSAILLWAHPPELERRRLSEATLFATGRYTRAEGNGVANA